MDPGGLLLADKWMDPPAWEAEAAWHVVTAAVLARLSFFPSVESLISTMRLGLLEDCL